jgi:hypothetical protein
MLEVQNIQHTVLVQIVSLKFLEERFVDVDKKTEVTLRTVLSCISHNSTEFGFCSPPPR